MGVLLDRNELQLAKRRLGVLAYNPDGNGLPRHSSVLAGFRDGVSPDPPRILQYTPHYMTENAQSPAKSCKWCGRAVFALCFLHILSVAEMRYQIGPYGDLVFFLSNYGVWLSPVLMVLLSRKSRILLSICSVPILIIFFGHSYYFVQRYIFNINIAKQSEWVWFLTTVTGSFSVGLTALLALFLLIKLVAYFIIRPFSGSKGGTT